MFNKKHLNVIDEFITINFLPSEREMKKKDLIDSLEAVGQEETLVIRLKDGTVFPNPTNELAWLMRHGDEKNIIKNRHHIASIIEAYSILVLSKTNLRRNAICNEIKKSV